MAACGALAAAVAPAGCGTATCTMMEPGELVRAARLFRLDVYDGATRCDGAGLGPGAPAPLLTRTVYAGEPLTLDVPPGRRTIVLIAYADDAGTQPIGSACTEAELGGGSASCLGLQIQPLPDGGSDCDGGECACRSAPDSCPPGTWCAADGKCMPGCKAATDCIAPSRCDLVQHRCVDCLDDVASNISSCGACGRVCSSTGVAAPMCASGLCTPSCVDGRGDCNRPIAPLPDDGCETNLYDPASCGMCNRPCMLDHATAKCPAGSCLIEACAGGFFDCDGTATNGCECAGVDRLDGQKGCCAGGRCQATHTNGFGQTFASCTALGTYDQTLATEAAAAYPMNNEKDTFLQVCPNTTTKVVCKRTTNTNGANASCVCWAYEDSAASSAVGKALRVTGTNTCMCPTPTGTSWQ